MAAVVSQVASKHSHFLLLMLLVFNGAHARRLPQSPDPSEPIAALHHGMTQLNQRLATLEHGVQRILEIALRGELALSPASASLSIPPYTTTHPSSIPPLTTHPSSIPPLTTHSAILPPFMDTLVSRVQHLEETFKKDTSAIKSYIQDTNRDVQNLVTKLEKIEAVEQPDNNINDKNNTSQSIAKRKAEHTSNVTDRATLSTGISSDDTSSMTSKLNASTAELHFLKQDQLSSEISVSISQQISQLVTKALDQTISSRFEVHRSTLLQDIRRSLNQIVSSSSSELRGQHKTLAQLLERRADVSPSIATKRECQRCHAHLRSCRHKAAPRTPSVKTLPKRSSTPALPTNLSDYPTAAHQAVHHMGGSWSSTPLPCQPDVTTVDALTEVKSLLRSLLGASEDLRRAVSSQTSKGLDQLDLLHQRFAMLIRRINNTPDTGRALISEVKELENLVESSYASILHAQNVFIASCHRVQDEEPVLEAKITDILDMIATSITLGQQYNRQQLGEIRQLVETMGGLNHSSLDPLVSLPTRATLIPLTSRQSRPASTFPNEQIIKRQWTNALESVNSTSERLGDVATRVAQVQNRLLTFNWEIVDYKEMGDQLLTSAKDLYGHAITQLRLLNGVRSSLQTAVETKIELNSNNPLYLVDPEVSNSNQVILPRACTEALIPLIRTSSALRNINSNGDEHISSNHKIEQTTEYSSIRNSAERDNDPNRFSRPNMASVNYGTPQNRYPIFNQNEWVDQNDDYRQLEDSIIINNTNYDIILNDETNRTDSVKSHSLGLGETRLYVN